MSNSSSTSILTSNTPTQSNDAINNRMSATERFDAATASPPTTSVAPVTATHTHSTASCDTTNIHNTTIDSCDDYYYETQPRSLAALAERDRRREQLYLQQLAQRQQSEQQSVNNTSTDRVLVERHDDGASLQTNAIDSSSAMIVNESRVSCENNVNKNCANDNKNISSSNINSDNSSALHNSINPITTNKRVKTPQNRINNNNNLISNNNSGRSSAAVVSNSELNQSDTHRFTMEHRSKVSAINVPVSSAAATGKTVSLPSKMQNFESKKPKPGFLSRFTNFRFSLRGSKKKLKSLDNAGSQQSSGTNNIVLVSTKSLAPYESSTNHVDQVAMRNKNNSNNSRAGCYQRNSMRSNEFEYIPLKDPIAAVVFDTPTNVQTHERYVGNATNNNGFAAGVAATAAPNKTIAARNALKNDNSCSGSVSAAVIAAEKKNASTVVTSKPPLPRQPPRVVGVCAKQQSSTMNSSPCSYQSAGGGGGVGHKSATLAQSNPYREGAGRQQRHAHHHQQRATSAPREINFDHTDNGNFHYLANDIDYQSLSSRQSNELSSRSRGGILKGAVSSDGLLMDVNENSFCAVGDEDDEDGDDGKIGMIETNLDTNETIISGKTRSLMELGPQMANRSNANVANHHRLGKHGANGVDPTSCEPRRPHKSMEFLLDKENQRFVLVSLTFSFFHLVFWIQLIQKSFQVKKRKKFTCFKSFVCAYSNEAMNTA